MKRPCVAGALVIAGLCVGILGCDDGDDLPDPCGEVTCSDHGTCADNGGVAECNCASGYHADGLACVEDIVVDPCEGELCSAHGNCVVDVGGFPECQCDTGYHPVGLECTVDSTGWPPSLDSLYDPVAGCVLPACDELGDPGHDSSGNWVRTLTTTASNCSDLIQGFDSRAQVDNVLVEDPAPLAVYTGNCVYNGTGDHIITASGGIVARCESNAQAMDVISYETGITTFTANQGTGYARIYLVNVPEFVGDDCDFVATVEYVRE